MNLKAIANFAMKNEDVKNFVSQFATEEQVNSFFTAANKNKEFKQFQNSIFKNVTKNDGFKYADNDEDKYQLALDFATKTIEMFEDDYAKNMTDKYKNGKIDLKALGFDEEMFEKYDETLKNIDLDGDIESFSAQEFASYMMALDAQSDMDGIISLDDLKNIDLTKLVEDSKKNYESFA